MKQLLSTIFEQALEMTHLESTFYSTFCLVCFGICRAVSPLMAGGDKVFVLFVVVLLVESAACATVHFLRVLL